MSKQSGLGQQFYLNGNNLSGDVGAITNAAGTIAPLDVTAINKLAHERIGGRRSGVLAFTTFFNDATEQQHEALKGLPDTDVLALWLFSGTLADPSCAITAKQANYDMTLGTDGALTFAVQLDSTAGTFLEWGQILAAALAHSSATTATGFDDGAQTTDGAVGFLHAISAASGTVEYDIDDSSDSTNGVDGSWATLLSFTDVPAASHPTAERVEVAGTVERWTRTVTEGTFTTVVFSMAIRRRASGDIDAA